MTTFIRLVDVDVDRKADSLRETISHLRHTTHEDPSFDRHVFDRDPEVFAMIPCSPFAYWTTADIRATFARLEPLKNARRTAVFGASTKSDRRYLRLWWEVSPRRIASFREETSLAGRCWVLHAKGGKFAPYFAEIDLVLNWASDGRELKADISAYRELHGWGYHWTAALNGHGHYFRPGLTWSRRSQKGLSVRALPQGCTFADKGPAIFTKGDREDTLLAILAVANSSTFRYLVELQMAFGSYEVGVLQRTPVPSMSNDDRAALAALARRAFAIRWKTEATEETSHGFTLPTAVRPPCAELRQDSKVTQEEFDGVQERIDKIIFNLYNLGEMERREIGSNFVQSKSSLAAGREDDDGLDEGREDEENDDGAAVVDAAPRLVSWLAGVAFERFDARLATGERSLPQVPRPFDPMPVQSPGIRQVDDECTDILVDDDGHPRDLATLVAKSAALIEVDMPADLRRWLAREFFPFHIKMYSKSRRKAPIYWQLATPSASYSVWLYIHAFTRDTMFRVQNDYVVPKLRHEEGRLAALEGEAGERPTAADRREIDRQREFVAELRAFLDEVKRVAPLWDPDLDDGVIINSAPLWRLVPQYRPWQTELRKTWEELCAGKYDWARLAMRLWPERVMPKCATDRSLAIAHGLEDVFWTETRDGWMARAMPTRPLDELVAERSSVAVRAALRDLFEAPVTAPTRGGRRRAVARTTS